MVHNNQPCENVPGQPKKFHGNDAGSTEPRQTYTVENVTDGSPDLGKPYHGVGDVGGQRANQSLDRLQQQNPGQSFEVKNQVDHGNSAESLKDEYRRQKGSSGNDASGKPKNQYNKRWSPGKKLSNE